MKQIRSNIAYFAVASAVVLYFTYDAFNGIAFWQSNTVERNAGYHGTVAHSGYGARFYHK
ncbi:hypothetical protein AAFN85_29570 [Mucilaginibacter sp. CAU 1740]|uniref:hypothetical protein n=1 Tax=Mucilaginibacter sp. CAU 1740 TaxID=3140365 RepID=UPI00325B13F6